MSSSNYEIVYEPNFTFYCSSIKRKLKRYETLSNYTLHSTVVLLKAISVSERFAKRMPLHSTVVLLKVSIRYVSRVNPSSSLHSTVVLLKVQICIRRIRKANAFTFYCSSIKRGTEKQIKFANDILYILL